MTDSVVATPSTTGPAGSVSFRSTAVTDRAMRAVLGVRTPDPRAGGGAHRAFRISVVVSAVRCLITYVMVPVLVPILSLSGWVAAPIGIALCGYAVVNGVISLRRFWRADHPHRWLYTAFMGVVFVILTMALVSDLGRLGGNG
ncbi:hypothetical protein [Propioniciclava soli]|uniref:hypothetical protein n=1 Tax=Propioniciclava soli TaxID=2775081 RepID=UPI001E399894|nr:hypothetical protein [Propioniciclava soli]